MSHEWQLRKRPVCMERKYLFDAYDALRDFLDRVADLSEREEYYPDMSFGRTQVTMTIHAPEGSEEMPEPLHDFARQVDALYSLKDVSVNPVQE